MEANVSNITFLLFCTTIMLAIIIFMLSTMQNTMKTMYSLIKVKDEPDTSCANLPLGFEKVTGFNFTHCKRYKYVRNFISGEFFIYDTKTGQLVRVNLNPDSVNAIRKAFESDS